MLFLNYYIKNTEDNVTRSGYLNAKHIEAIRTYDCTRIDGCPDGYQVICWTPMDNDPFCLTNLNAELCNTEEVAGLEMERIAIQLNSHHEEFIADTHQA